jgi:hypothetical protein
VPELNIIPDQEEAFSEASGEASARDTARDSGELSDREEVPEWKALDEPAPEWQVIDDDNGENDPEVAAESTLIEDSATEFVEDSQQFPATVNSTPCEVANAVETAVTADVTNEEEPVVEVDATHQAKSVVNDDVEAAPATAVVDGEVEAAPADSTVDDLGMLIHET